MFLNFVPGAIKQNLTNQGFYKIPSIDIGYLLNSKKLGSTVDLGSGNITHVDRESIHALLPTLNFAFEKATEKLIGYYFQFFYGYKFSFNKENSAFAGVEIGLKFHLNRTK